jgi:D-amino-acid dehydrogenase
MFDPESPFYIKPRLDHRFLSWLWKFRGACSEANVSRALPVMSKLNAASLELFDELAALDGVDFNLEKNGVVQIFKTPKEFDKGIKDARRLQEFGVVSEVLEKNGLKPYVPKMRISGVGGIFFPQDAQLIPDRLVHQLARHVEGNGAELLTSTEVLGFESSGRMVTTVKTTRGDIDAEDVIVAGGSWSVDLARDLSINLPMEPAKGYSLTFKRSPECPEIPIMLAEAKVVITPMDDMLRIAGTLELAGLDMSINNRRLQAILKAVPNYFPDFNADSLELIEIWRGLRPCSPDGLPYIGRPRRYENVIIATGHGMKGISLAPVTGKIVSQLVVKEQPQVDMSPLKVERFVAG